MLLLLLCLSTTSGYTKSPTKQRKKQRNSTTQAPAATVGRAANYTPQAPQAPSWKVPEAIQPISHVLDYLKTVFHRFSPCTAQSHIHAYPCISRHPEAFSQWLSPNSFACADRAFVVFVGDPPKRLARFEASSVRWTPTAAG